MMTPTELEARTMIQRYMDANPDRSNEEQIVLNVFRAMWSNSLSQERIERIAIAMFVIEPRDLKPALDKLIKAGVLRRRWLPATALYEMNYGDDK
jgi:hypothetical protein